MNQYNSRSGGGRPYRQNTRPTQSSEKPHVVLTDENYVDLAEQAIDSLIRLYQTNPKDYPIVSTSKLRNLLSMTSDLYNEIVNELSNTIPKDLKGRIEYLRVRYIYDSGRSDAVKLFVTEADILGHLNDIKDSRKQFILFSRYMEALVAFRKFKFKKDE